MTSAVAEVLTAFLGTSQINVDIHGFDPAGPAGNLDAVHHFGTAGDLRTEIIGARLWAGLHYRTSSVAGVTLGMNVAQYDQPTPSSRSRKRRRGDTWHACKKHSRLGWRSGPRGPAGRSSGTVRRTLIYPVPLGDRFAVPLPYGPGAHWPQNVLAAGRARLEYRGRIYELVNPRPVGWADIEDVPRSDALIGRLIGRRFLVADVASVAEGGFEPVAA